MAFPVVTIPGMRAIERALTELHVKWSDAKARYDLNAYARAVRVYAADVENSVLEGGPAQFEIRAADSVTGRPEVVSLPEDSVEWW